MKTEQKMKPVAKITLDSGKTAWMYIPDAHHILYIWEDGMEYTEYIGEGITPEHFIEASYRSWDLTWL